MDKNEMQFMGLADIYREAYSISRCNNIFKTITSTLILPLSCFIFMAHIDISSLVFKTSQYLPDFLSFESVLFWFLKVVYLSFLIIFYNLSTSVVVYTISSIYRAGDDRVSLKKVVSVVPRAWEPLMLTFLCNFSSFLVFNISFAGIVTLLSATRGKFRFVQEIFLVVYAMGYVYFTIIWQLANVVSVLEDSCGFKSMIKSKNLIKGKLVTTMFIFCHLNCSFGLILILFGKLVVYGKSMAMLQRITVGLICFCLLCALILYGLIIQTIIYFVCKSYHLENIDKSTTVDEGAV